MVKVDVLAAALAGLRPVRTDARRCVAVRSPRTPCTRCTEICPEGAITPGPTVTDCSGCGLCAAICPADVFLPDSPSDQELLQQAAAVARRTSTLSVSCRAGAGALKVGCLGRLTAEWLLAAVSCGFTAVDLVRPAGACAGCRYAAGEAMAERAVQQAQAVLGSTATLRIAEKAGPERAQTRSVTPVNEARRSFLLSAFGLIREAPAPEGSPRRRLLLQALPGLNREAAGTAPRPVLTGTCHHCGICERLCSDGAIAVKQGRLEHSVRRCAGCGVCVAVCPVGALTLELPGVLGDLQAAACNMGTQQVMTCPQCGEHHTATAPMAGSGDSRCLPCRMRPGGRDPSFD